MVRATSEEEQTDYEKDNIFSKACERAFMASTIMRCGPD